MIDCFLAGDRQHLYNDKPDQFICWQEQADKVKGHGHTGQPENTQSAGNTISLLFISYKFVKGFFAITFLLRLISS